MTESQNHTKNHTKKDYSYTQNREVSWLRFNKRVLEEAFDPHVPLLEKLKFCAIFQSNLDEWFMIRVGGLSSLASLKKQPTDNKSGMTPAQQLETIFGIVPDLLGLHEDAFFKTEHALKKEGIIRVLPEDFSANDETYLKDYFDKHLAPVLSPLVIDPRHPFPNLRNGLLYIMCELRGKDGERTLGMIEIPPQLARMIELPEKHLEGRSASAKKSETKANIFRYVLIEDVIASCLEGFFGTYCPLATSVVRVTRNADLDPDGEGVAEEEDYRQHMVKILKKRMRLEPVRATFQGYLDEPFEALIAQELGLATNRIQHLEMPLELSYVFGLEKHLNAHQARKLLFKPFSPQETPMVDPSRPVKEQVLNHDVLLCYPYESMRPLLRLIHDAATDDTCVAIRITLYRVAKESRLCESLIEAAENGKDVTVLMELRARFDEENNIEWAERLEAAGCTVIYGFEGFKCHSKICQITYHTGRDFEYITCLGTGNFNEKTARLYSDFMLLTAHPGIAKDGTKFFKNLMTGRLSGNYDFLGVAPAGLKPLIMEGLEREIKRAKKGKEARVFLKMNSLTDRDVIDKLQEASAAGVEIVMIVRGICCLLPGVKGKTKKIEVHQIVGRFLEHARIYAFGTKYDIMYLSSADMMTRNTERRVEIAYPILDTTCKKMVVEYIRLQKKDNVKGRKLSNVGTWEKIKIKPNKPLINSQEIMLALAYLHAQAVPAKSKLLHDPFLEDLPEAVLKRLIKINMKYKERAKGAQLRLSALEEAENSASAVAAPLNETPLDHSAQPNAPKPLRENAEVVPFVPKDVQIAENVVEGDISLENASTDALSSAESTGRLWSTTDIANAQKQRDEQAKKQQAGTKGKQSKKRISASLDGASEAQEKKDALEDSAAPDLSRGKTALHLFKRAFLTLLGK